MRKGCKVYILKDANPHTIPAGTFYGAVNLDVAAQTCTIPIFGSANVNDNASMIMRVPALGIGVGTAALIASADGIRLDEGLLSFQASSAPSGDGIALYYDGAIN